MQDVDLEKVLENLSSGKSDWRDKAEFRRENRANLDKTREVIVRLLKFKAENNLHNSDICELFQISIATLLDCYQMRSWFTDAEIENIEKILIANS